MLKPILAAFKHGLVDSDVLASIRHRLKYPGITVAGDARISGSGNLAYGVGCSIGKRSRLVLNTRSRLELGPRCRVDDDVEIQPDNGAIVIGEETSIQKRCTLIGDLNIGSYCLFAPNVFVSSGAHQFELRPELLIRDQDDLVTHDAGVNRAEYHRKVVIEDDCWIGANTVIMRGVTIAKGSVIGANSVVTKDVPPYSVAAGSPAKVIKSRLAFLPKVSIDATDEKDWPYFYSGFAVRKSRQAASDAGSLLVRGDAFSVCLSGPTEMRKISIEVASLTQGELLLNYLGVDAKVDGQTKTCSFPFADSPPRGIHAFRVLTSGSRSPTRNSGLRIRRIFLE